MATNQWFVRGGGKVYGPLESARLKQLAVEGKIDQRTEIAHSAEGPWHPAGSLKGLFSPSGSALGPSRAPQKSQSGKSADVAAATSAPPPGDEAHPAQPVSVRESFGNWYQRTAGGWNKAMQIGAWLCGGYVVFPLWWALSGNVSLLKVGKWVGIAFVALLGLGVVMNLVDPEGMKKARERSAQAAAERREKAKVEEKKKGEIKGAHVAAGLVASDMKSSGKIRPRGDALNALARGVANEMNVEPERRAEFVRDFEWAFNLAWDKSN